MTAFASTIAGGQNLCVASSYGTIAGGCNSTIGVCSECSNIGGGGGNIICCAGVNNAIGGGGSNRICNSSNPILSSYGNFIGGGVCNLIQGLTGGTIVGGFFNTLSGLSASSTLLYPANFSTIEGGCSNLIIGASASSIVGGFCNILSANPTSQACYSFIAGGCCNFSTQPNTFILGSSLTAASANYTYVNNICAVSAVAAAAHIATPPTIRTVTADYTLTTSDNGRVIVINNTSNNVICVPTGLDVGYSVMLIQTNTGKTTVSGTGVTINSFCGLSALAGCNAGASLFSYGTNIYNLNGTLGI